MTDKVRLYTVYDRIWHWVQAVMVTVLILTGFEISYSSSLRVFGFENAVHLHNVAALFLVVNAFLAFFYNIAGGLFERYVPGSEDIFPLGVTHARYYAWGIFRGEPHPFDKTPERRLFPLQKIAYFGVLNVLLPIMIVTGAAKIAVNFQPDLADSFGGLAMLGALHRFVAWLFLSFLIVHVYMITTGHKVYSNLAAMITGYEEKHGPGGEE